MGTINISIDGSFSRAMKGTKAFSAMESGHTAALGEAISYLSSLIPEAVRQDHQLQAEGAKPNDGFRIVGF